MSDKPKLRLAFLLPLLIIVGLCVGVPLIRFVLREYDTTRLAKFAHRIADTDRIVGTYARSSVSLTLTGDDARKVVRAVSSAKSDRPPFGMKSSCSFFGKATFFRGTNVLDHIEMCGSLFLIHYSEPPFRDDTGLLDTLVNTPLVKALEESWQKENGTNY
jgi:hypothetical protein